MSEPNVEVFHCETIGNRTLTWLAATRPAFLTASVLPVVVGIALAWKLAGTLQMDLAILSVVNIILIHAAANVLNDYFDAISGTDEINTGRIFPFTGGSRFIQNGVLSQERALHLGLTLMAAGAILGTYMVIRTGPELLLLGLIGATVSVLYSAPPCLACRGVGDLAIGLCFGVLPVVGTVFIQTGTLPEASWWMGAVIGFFVVAILWVNSIPDIEADRKARKMTLPARLGTRIAGYGLPSLFGAGFALLIWAPLPGAPLWVLLGSLPAAAASVALLNGNLTTAIPLTLVTHTVVCLLLTGVTLL